MEELLVLCFIKLFLDYHEVKCYCCYPIIYVYHFLHFGIRTKTYFKKHSFHRYRQLRVESTQDTLNIAFWVNIPTTKSQTGNILVTNRIWKHWVSNPKWYMKKYNLYHLYWFNLIDQGWNHIINFQWYFFPKFFEFILLVSTRNYTVHTLVFINQFFLVSADKWH